MEYFVKKLILIAAVLSLSSSAFADTWSCNSSKNHQDNNYVDSLSVNVKDGKVLSAQLIDREHTGGDSAAAISEKSTQGTAGTIMFSMSNGPNHDWQDYDVMLIANQTFDGKNENKAIVTVTDTEDCLGTATTTIALECSVK